MDRKTPASRSRAGRSSWLWFFAAMVGKFPWRSDPLWPAPYQFDAQKSLINWKGKIQRVGPICPGNSRAKLMSDDKAEIIIWSPILNYFLFSQNKKKYKTNQIILFYASIQKINNKNIHHSIVQPNLQQVKRGSL